MIPIVNYFINKYYINRTFTNAKFLNMEDDDSDWFKKYFHFIIN